MKSGRSLRWNAFGRKVRGAAHIKNDKPCQDALLIKKNAKKYLVASLSDGHGSSQCPYSDEGAEAAVHVACEVFDSIFESNGSKGAAFNTIKANKDIWLPKQIEKLWKTKVREIHSDKRRSLSNVIDSPNDFPYALYGATLLTLLVTDEFIFALQLGDGDILTIDREIEKIDWLIPPAELLGNETDSLCLEDCWKYMKTHLQPWAEEVPMFLLATDGYHNSFSAKEGFKKAGADICNMWHENGSGFIEEHLEDWLVHSSANGSGDDISVAIVFLEDL